MITTAKVRPFGVLSMTPQKIVDPLVRITVWEGPASALAALLRIPPHAINGLLAHNAKRTVDGYAIDVASTAVMSRARCTLLRTADE